MNNKVLLFDIDGTLLLTGGAGKIAFEYAFEKHFDVSNGWGDVIPDGKTDHIIFEEIFKEKLNISVSPEEYKNFCNSYIDNFPSALEKAANFRLMPGTTELLNTLSKLDNVILGIVTGNFKETAWEKLKYANFHSFFEVGGFGSDSRERYKIVEMAIKRVKETYPDTSFSKEDIYIIGDTPLDAFAAKKNNVKTVLVATGSYSFNQLKEADPDYVFEDFSDPNGFLKELALK